MHTMTYSPEALEFLQAMDDELASNAEASGVTLAFSVAERETLHNVAHLIDRKVELRKLYQECGPAEARLKIALSTEVRLIESAITRLTSTIDMCAPEAEESGEVLTPVQVKARAAANSRWHRERLRKRAEQQRRSS
jgi:hypothetical protein